MIFIFIMFPVKLIIRLLHGIMKVCFLDAIWYIDSRILIWRTSSLSCRNIWSIRTTRAKDADDFRIHGMTALFDCIRVESQILTQGPIPAFRVMKWPAITLKTALIWYRFLRCAPFLFGLIGSLILIFTNSKGLTGINCVCEEMITESNGKAKSEPRPTRFVSSHQLWL